MPPEIPASVSAATDAAPERRARNATLITLGILLVLVALVVILTPVSDSNIDTRLTTQRYGSGNAKLVSDLAARLGWRVRVVDQPLRGALDTTAIYLVFAGPTAMPANERGTLLSAVRRGAGLLVAPRSDGEFALLDSLGLRTGTAGLVDVTPLGTCAAETDPLAALRVRTRMLTFTTAPPTGDAARTAVPYPQQARTMLSSSVRIDTDTSEINGDSTKSGNAVVEDSAKLSNTMRPAPTSEATDSVADTASDAQSTHEPRPTMVAFPLGRGRVVALADPDVLRTDQLRNCAQGLALSVVRGLEYLSEGRSRSLTFAEFYQRENTDGAGTVVWEWLRFSSLGRGVLTLIAAGLLLLLARGRRTLAPVTRLREERRSALEHVDALATAWQAVRGTRTAARMLARGIRRRHAAGRWRTLDDAAFLAALAERHPAIADDAASLQRAMESPPTPSDLPALRASAAHIDAECLTP
jgi:hypothetical protein